MIPRRALALLCPLIVLLMPLSHAHAQPPAGQPAKAPAPPPVRLQRGVVVIAAKQASTRETWRLATQVYQDASLRPRGMVDATARVLAGEPPPRGANRRDRELYELRASLAPTGASTRRLLASIASEIGVSGVVLTYPTPGGQTHARLFVSKRGDFQPQVLWPQPDDRGIPSWASSVAWLCGLTTTASSARGKPSENSSVFASPWFWGALTAAAGVAIVGYAATRDEGEDVIHLQGRVSP